MLREYLEFLCDSDISYIENEPLSRHSTFRIGGPARVFVVPTDADQLKEAYNFAKEHSFNTYILGRGSNVVFSDNGFDGVVISTEKMNDVCVDGKSIVAGCGFSFTQLAVVAKDAGLSGIEFAYGIPGSVGGAVYMNAGAYGGEVCQCLTSSCCYDAENDCIRIIDAKDHDFGYRTSIYKKNQNLINLSCEFALENGNPDEIKAKMDDFMGRRRDKQPLEFPSAGSAFKRPEGYFAGKLIEDSNLKGYSVGGAQVSEKHAGFIINKGGATCKDVEDLVAHIKKTVLDNFGVTLECEIIFVK